MKNNSGRKLMNAAIVLEVLGVSGSIILGLWIGSEVEEFLGAVCFIVGCLSTWISSLFLEAVGDQVDNSYHIVWLLQEALRYGSPVPTIPPTNEEPYIRLEAHNAAPMVCRPVDAPLYNPEPVAQEEEKNALVQSDDDFLVEMKFLLQQDGELPGNGTVIFCANCGAKHPVGRTQCAKCGARL